MSAIGNRIAHARACRTVGRRALADYCGLTEAQLYLREEGQVLPSSAEVGLIAKALLLREEDLRQGGPRWDSAVRLLRPIKVLGLLMDESTQFPQETAWLASDDRLPAFRAKEEPLAAPAPVPAPTPAAVPVSFKHPGRTIADIMVAMEADRRLRAAYRAIDKLPRGDFE